ncbi:5839_t:CDS:2 [Ambispora leptoticha]|uniref:5839_t:CDS:1 n=1 Tax=Ambispora leptoticha TaxID=144679 RepID=A0A9N9AIX3_9GLOM|nr:5839_t:CDS:2 [Ambispora leptoticha]
MSPATPNVNIISKNKESPRSLVFCYYVSGHGFGHATRVVQVASEILALPRRHKLYIVSNAPQFIFEGAISRGAKYRHALIDAGVKQPLAYTVDRDQTIDGLQAFMLRRREMVNRESSWLREVKADIVLSDAPFLPCAAAAAIGIPSSIVSNFTFDAVYSGMYQDDEKMDASIKKLIDQVTADYKKSNLLIRLPGYIPIPSFAGTQLYPEHNISNGFLTKNGIKPLKKVNRRVIDVPLVVRKCKTPREIVFDNLGIPSKVYRTHKVLLVSFGGQNLEPIDRWGSPLPEGWIAIVCGCQGVEGKVLPKRFYKCPVDAYIPDLTNAADVVMGKLGYGTCSECIAHAKPFIYAPRPQFIEENGLKRLMETQGSCIEMSKEDFESGQWKSYILRAYNMPGVCQDSSNRLTHDGGEIAAKILEQFLDDHLAMVKIETMRSSQVTNKTDLLVGSNDGTIIHRYIPKALENNLIIFTIEF